MRDAEFLEGYQIVDHTKMVSWKPAVFTDLLPERNGG